MSEIQTSQPIEQKKGNKGGYRPGAGRKPGSIEEHTKARQVAKELLEKKVIESHQPLILAQLSIAIGQQFLFKIEKQEIIGPKGGISYKPLPPKLVTELWEIESYLMGLVENGDMHNDSEPGATYYYITTKEPNNMAIDSLFNRLHGRPKETLDLNTTVKFSLKDLAQKRLVKARDTESIESPENQRTIIEQIEEQKKEEEIQIIKAEDITNG